MCWESATLAFEQMHLTWNLSKKTGRVTGGLRFLQLIVMTSLCVLSCELCSKYVPCIQSSFSYFTNLKYSLCSCFIVHCIFLLPWILFFKNQIPLHWGQSFWIRTHHDRPSKVQTGKNNRYRTFMYSTRMTSSANIRIRTPMLHGFIHRFHPKKLRRRGMEMTGPVLKPCKEA
jgi:hypothetical protein